MTFSLMALESMNAMWLAAMPFFLVVWLFATFVNWVKRK